MLRITRRLRAVTLAGLGAGLLLSIPATATAHVTVRADESGAGGFSKLTFRVPNESDSAGTVGVAATLPADTPFAFVSVKPHAGWTAEITRETPAEPVQVGDFTLDEIVTGVTWTADPGVQISPGEFDEFELSVGPLPADPGSCGYANDTDLLGRHRSSPGTSRLLRAARSRSTRRLRSR